MFAFQDARGSVEVAFTDRHAETGGGPVASLDLATRDGDERDLDLVAAAFTRGSPRAGDVSGAGMPVVARMRQMHGTDVAFVDETSLRAGRVPAADALVTGMPGVVLLVRVADCVPVLLADAEAQVVAAVHAGRRGLVAGVVPAAVRAMWSLGATTIHAWVGPHVCGACYEVPAPLRDEVVAAVPHAWATTSWGTPSLDLGAGVLAQLRTVAVQVTDASRCTVEDDGLWSYRRQGTSAGRLGGLVWTRP